MIALVDRSTPVSCPPISVRVATANDLPRIALITWQILVETDRANVYRFRDVLAGVKTVFQEARHGEYWIAESSEQFAGQLKLTPDWHDLYNREVATIEHVYVHPTFRGVADAQGKRVYDHLHQQALTVCHQRGVPRVQLHVVSDNHRAQRAYERRGMRSTGIWMTQGLRGE